MSRSTAAAIFSTDPVVSSTSSAPSPIASARRSTFLLLMSASTGIPSSSLSYSVPSPLWQIKVDYDASRLPVRLLQDTLCLVQCVCMSATQARSPFEQKCKTLTKIRVVLDKQ